MTDQENATGAETSLDEESIVAEARAKAGLEDLGDEGFREPLRRLLRSLDEEAALSPTGRATQRARLVESLVTRLMTEDHIRRHPEILDEAIEAPLVIVGLARTGTTMLHRLLGSGGDFQVARWWEVRYPAPFPGSDWRRDDPRIPAAHEEVRITLEMVPMLAAIHPWDPEGADEEIMLLEHSFLSHVPESAANVPSYRAWLEEQDLTPAYRYLDRLLRFLQWQKKESGRGGGRWVLKTPFHLGYVDTLFEVFPGARVIQTHRDPLQTIPSAASMYRSLWELNSEAVDPLEVGRQVRERFAWSLTRCMRSRERVAADRFLDVDYREVQKDPLIQVERIYAWLGRELSPEAEERMRAWLVENARDKRAPHRYTLEEFGYTEEGLRRDFAEYRSRHIA
jgi:hypothetical protein